jgi:diguanylate cyclase (GGDEF)-like protein/PAS domain S-box-containing protein
MMFAVGIWSFGYLLELIIPGLDAKIFWVNFQYIGIAAIPPLWFLFAYEFTGLKRHLTPVGLAVLFALPLVTVVLSWTNPLHEWMRSNVHVIGNGFLTELGKTWGIWFWVQLVYGYLQLFTGTILLISGTIHTQRIYRRQRLLMILAAVFPWIGNFLYISHIANGFDPSPLAFSLSGLLAVLGFFRWRLMDLVPVARASVLESLEDGVIVLDDHNRVVDANPAAAVVLGQPLDGLAGKTAAEVFAIWPDLCAMLRSNELTYALQIEIHGAWYDLRVEPVSGRRERILGRMDVLRDVTALHLAETRLRILNEGLEQRVQQRTVELSDELANRRQAEIALVASEERYALAARGANDGLWDWDIRSGSVFFSSRWSEIFGLKNGDMVGSIEEWFSRVHPDDVDRVRRELDAHLRGDADDFRSEHRIITKQGDELWVLARGQAIFSSTRAPLRMAGSFSDTTLRKNVEDQLVHNAMHDLLTGMPNRALFLDRLGRSIERLRRNPDTIFGVLYLDFDRFKLVNDSLGHNIGDLLLIASARRLETSVRGIDTAARLGGDEFVILLDDIAGPEDAIAVAERVQKDLGIVFQLEGYQVYNSASIGIVISRPDYERADEVLRDADIAMYHAKLLGRARYAIFDSSMRERTRTRLEIETDLRHALDRGEFKLHYQPLVHLEKGQLCGFEALLRWHQPERGEVQPVDFIPVAEETGLILPIGRWVLFEACRQMSVWREIYPTVNELSVSVNVSARQLSQGIFADEVEAALRQANLPASALRLELTESALLEENEIVGAALTRLRELGVALHLDDFGTGYSSLSYLHRYQVDALKIDRSFVTRMGTGTSADEIVRTILTLARELKLNVVAEGVETPEQMSILQSLNCEFGQGFWIARPLATEDAEEAIRQYAASLIV